MHAVLMSIQFILSTATILLIMQSMAQSTCIQYSITGPGGISEQRLCAVLSMTNFSNETSQGKGQQAQYVKCNDWGVAFNVKSLICVCPTKCSQLVSTVLYLLALLSP